MYLYQPNKGHRKKVLWKHSGRKRKWRKTLSKKKSRDGSQLPLTLSFLTDISYNCRSRLVIRSTFGAEDFSFVEMSGCIYSSINWSFSNDEINKGSAKYKFHSPYNYMTLCFSLILCAGSGKCGYEEISQTWWLKWFGLIVFEKKHFSIKRT